MSQPATKCKVCGGIEYALEAGSFFCLECNTQSQDIREEVYDEYFGAQKGVTRVLKKKSSKAKTSDDGKNVKLTSWELLNYVLKGITHELIELGAKQELKTVVLQLWATYLRNLEVAFTSVDVERKPKLGYAFKRSDAELVYGVTSKQLREKSWRSRSPSNASSRASNASSASSKSPTNDNLNRRSALMKLSFRKKALASAEYSQLSQNTAATCSQTLEELDSSSATELAETPKRMKVTRHAKVLLSSPCASSTEDESTVRRRLLKREISSTRNITTAKLVAIVNIALALTHQRIQLSDFIRWVEEGHVSLGTLKKFLPANAKVTGETEKSLELEHLSYLKCQSVMVAMCDELGVDSLPPPDLCGLAERYCTELQLPGELMEMVQRLLTSLYGIPRLKHNRILNWKTGELLTMAAVVFVTKLLFSLDDSTEHQISKTASALNRHYAEEGKSTRLFSWREWVRYIECRKAVVAAHHLPTKKAVYDDTVPHDPQLFLQHYTQTADQLTDYKETNKYNALNKEWVEKLSRCLAKLTVEPPADAPIVFPTSLTPLHSCVEVLLSRHAERVTPAAHVLRQDFTSHSILHVTSPEQCLAFGLVNDLNIVQRVGSAATFKEEKIKIRDKDLLTIPKYKVNQVDVPVHVTESTNEGNKKKEMESGKINENDKFLEILSDESDEEDDNADEIVSDKSGDTLEAEGTGLSDSQFELFNTGTQYWFCHVSLTKHSCTNEEFEFLAMRSFPFSFLWLLKECSRIVRVHIKELYSYLVQIEKEHKCILKELEHLVKRKNKKTKSSF